MSRLPVGQLATPANPLNTGDAQAYHLPEWHTLSHPERLKVIRWIAEARGRDATIAHLAVNICKQAGVKPRHYEQQAAALLRWVQDPKNVYYMNEPGERLQDPLYTLQVGHGDCDDQVILLCCLFEACRLSWRLCLAGKDMRTGKKVRYIEGQPVPPNCKWSHVYCMVGTPPFNPTRWYFCETTVNGVPLGWDVVSGDKRHLPKGLPEMQNAYKGKPRIMGNLIDYAGSSSLIPLAVGVGLAESGEAGSMVKSEDADGEKKVLDWGSIRLNIFIGVATAVGTTMVLQWINAEGIWAKTPLSLPYLLGLKERE